MSAKMATLARRDTAPELALRRELHRRGLRFRVQLKVPGNRRRTIDIAFTRARLAVYVDGCFWHGCPDHHHRPRANAEWWEWKVRRNQERDRDTDQQLALAGWRVLRIWEHVPVAEAADRVGREWRSLVDRPPRGATSGSVAGVARVREIKPSVGGSGGVHPTEVDCGWQVVTAAGGERLLQLSTYGSDKRASEPKVSQTLQLDREAALRLRAIIDQTFGR